MIRGKLVKEMKHQEAPASVQKLFSRQFNR